MIAILGPTACGKTALSIELARSFNAHILSLDSLSIYKQIDIASAKPSLQERGDIVHFGIDVLRIDEPFNVTLFFDLFKMAKEQSLMDGKNLIIVGGTGFYLKSLIEGVSTKPQISQETKISVAHTLKNQALAYELLEKMDPASASKIAPADVYRIEKWLEIYYQTGLPASKYFALNERKPILEDIRLFEIEVSKETLRDNITQRTKSMLENGLIDEVCALEREYSRLPHPMRSIGIKETLDFLDGFLDKKELQERIIIHTMQLAKRQKTFNKAQFADHPKAGTAHIKTLIAKELQKL